MRHAQLICAILLLALVSCGGTSSQPQVATVPDEVIDAGVRGGLPGIPRDVPFQLTRMTAAVDQEATLLASAAVATSNTAPSLGDPNVLEFNSAAGQVAYSLYQFTGAPGEAIDVVRVTASSASPNARIYVAIANYATMRWQFAAPSTNLVTELTFTGGTNDYTSPSGTISVLVATYGGDTIALDSVAVGYPSRNSISGMVTNLAGVPLPGVVISVGIPNQFVVTDAAGNYLLPGIPDGNWGVYATSHGYTFFSNPGEAIVAGAPLSGVNFIGEELDSNLQPRDPNGPNNEVRFATPVDFAAGPYMDSLSGVDDRTDFLKFTLDTPGNYLLQFSDPTHELKFPDMQLNDELGNFVAQNGPALSGSFWLSVQVFSAPVTYVLAVSANIGAGPYELSLISGAATELEGHVDVNTGTETIAGASVMAVQAGDSLETLYSVSPFATLGGSFYDYDRPAVDAEFTPLAPHYTYVPASYSATLSVAPDYNIDFVGTPVPVGDTYEPNGDAITANGNGNFTLPYSSDGVDDLSVGNGDTADWYRVEPAMGLGLRAIVDTTPAGVDSVIPGSLLLYDDDGATMLEYGTAYNGRMTVTLPTLTDGAHYYIAYSPDSVEGRILPYRLEIETFTAQDLFVSTLFDGQPLQDARVIVRENDMRSVRSLNTSSTGMTSAIKVGEGSEVFIEVFRYGAEFHRHTRRVVIPASATTVTFEATDANSLDSYEPNDDPTTAPFLPALPASFEATKDPSSDNADCYRLALTSADPVGLTLGGLPAGAWMNVNVYDETNMMIDSFTLVAGQTYYFDPGAAGERRLQFFGGFPDTTYTVDLAHSEAYVISGKALDGLAMAVPVCFVYCAEIDYTAYCDPITGDYYLPLLAPGTYTLTCWSPGQTSTPETTQVVISNAAVTQDFALLPDAGADNYEPNDTPLTAAVIPVNGNLSLPNTLSVGIDLADYFKFPLTLGDTVVVRLEWAEPWYTPTYLWNIETPTMGPAATFSSSGPTFQQMVFEVIETGDHVLEVQNFGTASEYQVRVQINP